MLKIEKENETYGKSVIYIVDFDFMELKQSFISDKPIRFNYKFLFYKNKQIITDSPSFETEEELNTWYNSILDPERDKNLFIK